MQELSNALEISQHAVELPRETPSQVVPVARCLLCEGAIEKSADGLHDTRFGIEGTYTVFRCRGCGFEQLFPLPAAEKLKVLYETHYNFGAETNTMYTKLRERFLFSLPYRIWAWVDGDISFHLRRGCGRLLDIGCNEGRGLRMYSRSGFQVEGLELNTTAASVARASGFVVHTTALEEFCPTHQFDVVVLSNVLEHSLNPQRMLRDVKRVLAPGGQIWISCPNSLSWQRAIWRRFWINWHVPFHVSHFTPKSLGRLLTEVGFTDVKVQQITPALWVAQSIIAWLFSKEGKKNKQLRNPFLTLFLMMLSRFMLFPALWTGNKLERGDCLLLTALKPCEF